MAVFISHSKRSEKYAEQLAAALRDNGFSPWLDTARIEPGQNWGEQIETALRSSHYIILLCDGPQEVDPWQRRTMSEVLNVMWEDKGKRLIPVLLRDAELPRFLHNAAKEGEVQAIRVKNPQKEWSRAVEDLVQVLKKEKQVGDIDLSESISPDENIESEQEERLSYIGGVAAANIEAESER
jgi:hypothetical protein